MKLFRAWNTMSVKKEKNGGLFMEYLTAAEVAKKWNVSSRRVTLLCTEGRVNGAIKKGFMWLIPETATKPIDPRKIKENNKRD